MRAELTPAERAECMARRKAVWQRMQAYDSPVKPDDGKTETVSVLAEDWEGDVGGRKPPTKPQHQKGFAADTAAKTGSDKRRINEDVRRGEKIAPAVMARVKADAPLRAREASLTC